MVLSRPLQIGLSPSSSAVSVQARDAAEYLALKRQYKGLETPLTGAERIEASLVVEGRMGRAAGYSDEPNRI